MKGRLSAIIGNFLEHYDTALFGLIAPFIAPLCFPHNDPVTALILTYGMLPLGLFTRPLGALFFGWMGDKIGRKEALFSSLLGMSLVTLSMGSLPLHPLMLAIGRMLQSFCAAGESTGGAIFVLEQTDPKKRNFISSLYDVSSMGGALLASFLVALFSYYGIMETRWRVLFWFGGFTALAGFVLRLTAKNAPVVIDNQKKLPLKHYQTTLLSLMIASGFSHVTYALTFTLMNGFIPLITSLSKREVMQANTWLLILDMGLLPCFGYLATRFGKEKIMLLGALGAFFGGIPLFMLLSEASLGRVIFVRILILMLGVAFAAPYYAWSLEQVPVKQRYRLLSLGSALGSQLIGAPAPAVCLWLYQKANWSAAPGLYLALMGALATVALGHPVINKLLRIAPSKKTTHFFPS